MMMKTVIGTILFEATSSAFAATPPPNEPGIVDTSVLDMGVSPEEQMVSGELPATPESGSENAEDLLRSAPSTTASGKDAISDATDDLTDLPPPFEESEVAPSSELSEISDTPPMENVLVPAEPETAMFDESAGSSVRSVDRSIPGPERENPSWGIDVHGSLQALGTPIKSQALDAGGNPVGPIRENGVSNFGIGFEYQPQFLQSLGVVSIGPNFNMYLIDPESGLTEGSFSIFSVGGSVKYQLRFMRGQVFVPFVGYEIQQLRYTFRDATIGQGWTMASGPTFGALIYLNWIEPSAAHNFWAESGVKRSYLVAEMKNLSAEEPILSSEGTALYFGVRMEY